MFVIPVAVVVVVAAVDKSVVVTDAVGNTVRRFPCLITVKRSSDLS